MPELPETPRAPVAPLSRRAAAGAVDAAAVLLLSVAGVAVPWRLTGFTLPMVAVLAALLGWSVAPLVAFGATAGMRLFGLEMHGPDGRRPDPVEVAFRELLGRGLLPASYLAVLAVGAAGALLRRSDLGAPGRFTLVLVLACALAALIAAAGHLLALARPDGRSLADLLGRTRVAPRAIRAEVVDPDAQEEARLAARRTKRVFVGFVLAVGILGLAVPVALGQRLRAGTRDYTERLMRERAERMFEQNPGDPELAAGLIERLERAGDADAAARARARHAAARAVLERSRELTLRESLARDPHDEGSASALVELLLEQGRRDDARDAARAFYEATPGPRARVRYGAWLRGQGWPADAAQELEAALGEEETAEGHAYLGLALRDLRRFGEARARLRRALELEPGWEELREELEALEADGAL